jgi:hypothetical protein
MSNFELILRGKFFNSSQEELKELILEKYKEASKEIEEFAKREFKQSVELAAIIGQYADPEAFKAVLRSIKVELTPTWPPDFIIKFEDDLSHWYEGTDLPLDLTKAINNTYDSAITKWSLNNNFGETLSNIIGE